MALFFDGDWFDARLAARGLSREILAVAAGMSLAELSLVFKDQREISAAEVAAFAELLGVSLEEAASRSGTSTPNPGVLDTSSRVADLERRVSALEAEVARLRGR